MSASAPSSSARTGLSYGQAVTVLMLIILGLGTEILIVANYFQLAGQLSRNFTPATTLLPKLSALRIEVLRLHTETEAVLHADLPDFSIVEARRSRVAERLADLRAAAAGRDEYAPALEATDTLLAVYDTQIAILRGRPGTERMSVLTFELKRSFSGAETALDELYRSQEQQFFGVTTTTLVALGNIQIIMLAGGAMILVFGGLLLFAMRRSAQREIRRFSNQLQVAAEVGRAASSLLSLDELFDTALALIRERFGFYHTSIFLLDEKGEYAVLRAATGPVGQDLLERSYRMLVGSNSVIGFVTGNNLPRFASDVRRDPMYYQNELLTKTRSELAVPIRQGGQLIGALDVQSTAVDAFSDEDVTVVQMLADQLGVAIGNAAEYSREKARAQQMAALSEAAMEITGPRANVDDLLDLIGERGRALLRADEVAVWVPADEDLIELKTSAGRNGLAGHRLRRGEGIAGQALEAGQALRVDDHPAWPGRSYREPSFESGLAVPMTWRGKGVGALVFANREAGRPFSDADEHVAQLFAAQAAAAIENTQLLRETQQRLAELATINSIGQTLSSQLELQALLTVVGDKICQTFGVSGASIALYDSATARVEMPYFVQGDERKAVAPFPVGEGLTSVVIRTAQPLLINREVERHAAELGARVSGAPARSYLAVPILAGHDVIGVISIQDAQLEGRFGEADTRLLTTIAANMAVSIRNARLFEEAQGRARQLISAAEVSRASASLLNTEDLVRQTVELIRERFDLYYAALFLVEPSGQWAVLRHATGPAGQALLERGHRLEVGGRSMVGSAIARRQARIALDVGKEPIRFANPLLPDTHSEMALPLVVGETVLGALDVQSTQVNAFSEADITVLQTMADQIAVAIGNAEQYSREQRRAEQLVALSEVAAEFASPQTDLEMLFRLITRHAAGLFGVDGAALWLAAGPDELELKDALTFGVPLSDDQPSPPGGARPAAQRLKVGEGLPGQVLQTGRLVRLDGSRTAAGGAGEPPLIQSVLAVPMNWPGPAAGVLVLTHSEPARAFTAEDERFALLFAAQAGAAIENTQLVQQSQRRVAELGVLNQLAAILSSSLELSATVQTAARQLHAMFEVDHVAVLLADRRAGYHDVVAEYPVRGAVGGRIPFHGDPFREQVLRTRAAIAVDSVRRDPRLGDEARADLVKDDIRSVLVAPLVSHGQSIGSFSLEAVGRERPFTPDELDLAQTVAAQVAVAIENARLLQETQTRLGELQTLNEIGQAIAAQSDLRSLYDAVRIETARAVHAPTLYVALYDPANQAIEIPYWFEDGQASSLPPAPLGQSLTSIVVRTRQPLLIGTGQEAAARGAIAAEPPPESYLGAPLIVADDLLGVLAVQDSVQKNRFTESDRRLLATIATQLGLAVQNVRLLEQTHARAEQLAALNRVNTAATAALDVTSMLNAVVREIVHTFEARKASIALLNPARTELAVVADSSADASEPSARGVVLSVGGSPAASRVIEKRQPLVIPTPQANPLTEALPDFMLTPSVACLMMVPLLVRGEAMGAVVVDTAEPDRIFTPAEVALAETIAGQIASAMENGQLYQQVQRRASQLLAAAEVARASISVLNPEELIARAVELIRERFDLYYAALFLVEPSGQWAVLRHATGPAGQALLERGHRLEVGGRSMVGSAIARRQARIALDVGKEPIRFANPLLPDTHSEMALPLVVGETVLGALDVQSTQVNAFSEADITVLQTMADQIAIGIQNARLYREARQRAQTEQLINRVAGKIRRAVDAEGIVATALSELNKILGTRRAVAQLGPEQHLLSAGQGGEDGRGNGRGQD